MHLLLNPNESPLIESGGWLTVTLNSQRGSLGSAGLETTSFDTFILTNFLFCNFFKCFVSLYFLPPRRFKKKKKLHKYNLSLHWLFAALDG